MCRQFANLMARCVRRLKLFVTMARAFSTILNVLSAFNAAVFDTLASRPVDDRLAVLACREEIDCALSHPANGKAAFNYR